MVARRYDPALGRFLGVDPMADEYPSWSPYNYTLNNPLNLIDPTGMCPEEESDRGCTGGVAGRFFESLRSTLAGTEMPFQFGALLADIGGELVKRASSRVVTRTGSAVTGAAFRNSQTGRFVSNQFGNRVTAASDATHVSINVVIPTQSIRR